MSKKSPEYLKKNFDVFEYVPEYLRNKLNSAFSRNLFNKLLTQEESIPLHGLIGDKNTNFLETRPYVPEASLDRRINSVIPMIYAKHGAEETVYAFSDIINKAKQLGIKMEKFQEWGECTSFNYVPPIDIDKFSNFSFYFWYGHLINGLEAPKWNPKLEPEYYVIGAPKDSNKNKKPVELATSANIYLNGYPAPNEQWIVEFTGPTSFSVNGTISGGNASGTVGTTFENFAISFIIKAGGTPFQVGDKFTLTVNQLTPNHTFTYAGVGNGTVTGLRGKLDYQIIDGEQVYPGQRILVKDQINAEENGIYVVSAGEWSRASDCDSDEDVENGVLVYVTRGDSNKGLYYSEGPLVTALDFSKFSKQYRNVSEWTEFNFWAHIDDLPALGLDINKMVQAKRPIIEYPFDLEMSTDSQAGEPKSGNVSYNAVQLKTKFNQLPLFNLYKTNGFFSKSVSSIFYYEEDALAPVDKFMKRRIKLNQNNDFIFSQGCIGEDGEILCFKVDGDLKCIWEFGNTETPQYVYGDFKSTSVEVPVDPELSTGVFLTPFQLEFNTYHENRKSVIYADLINHFRSIIAAQDDIDGSPFGRNNFRTLENKQLGKGGKIKEHNGAFNLFISMLCQDDVSAISMLDFAETQYAQAINSVNEFVNNEIIDFISAHGTPVFDGNDEISDGIIEKLFNEYAAYYADRVDVSSYLSASTSVIPNWPITLPHLGVKEAVQPGFSFDHDLGINVIVHHDGHLTPKNQRNIEFDRALTRISVARSDGSETPGIFSAQVPSSPFKNQLWFDSTNNRLYAYVVASDSSTAPENPVIGDLWFNRSTGQLFERETHEWVELPDVTIPWKLVETEKILNALILNIETKLFNSVHEYQPILWDLDLYTSEDTLETEFLKFAAKYGFDPFAPDYQNSDAFTWNYSQADIPTIGDGTARWHDVYKKYFAAEVGIEVTRPNLEPWKLFGFSTPSQTFIQTYLDQQILSDLPPAKVKVVFTDAISDFSTCPSVVDGINLVNGDRVLVTSASNPASNGIYLVTSVGTGSNGVWQVAPEFNPFAITIGDGFEVSSGQMWNQTIWSVSNTSPLTITQVRTWKLDMWFDLLQAKPNLKTCVNIFNEQLLPPFVDSSNPISAFALLIQVPAGISSPYVFGDNGPTEAVWKKSLEHPYSLLRSGFKNQPIKFLEDLWGAQDRTVNSFTIDKQFGRKISHQDILLHGENIPIKHRARIIQTAALPVTLDSAHSISLTCDLQTDSRDYWKLEIDGQDFGYKHETDTKLGIPVSQIQINDEGFGFEIGDIINFEIAENGTISNVEFIPAKQKIINGFGQIFTQLLKFNSISLSNSKNIALFRNWEARLGHRFDAFVKSETLDLSSDIFKIPLELCDLVMKVNPFAKSEWINALRIQLVQVGSTTLENGIYKPNGNGDDWIFRIENYYAGNPTIKYFELDTNGSYQTFFALDKRRSANEWKQYLDVIDVRTASMPKIVKGIQNVVNFLFGYIRYLEDRGWRINLDNVQDIDAETGRAITWQLEVEKFVDAAFNNLTPGAGVIINPFMKTLWFETPVGLVSKFETLKFFDSPSSQFTFDILGSHISTSNLKVVREDSLTSISSAVPLYGAHINVETYEHAVLFPYYLDNINKTHLIFDPFLGLSLKTLFASGRRQAVRNGRPSFGGFFLNDGQMNRNIVSTIDDLGKIYDSESVYENPNISKYALALFGHERKEYFKGIDVSDKTQFNFWRGMIQAKGTNMSVDAFINNVNFEEAKIDEYWAFKIAEYGDARIKSFPELKLTVRDCLLENTRFQFREEDSTIESIPEFTQVSPTDSDRWMNLDDLNELKDRGMYFDAVSVGKVVLKERPIFGIVNAWNPLDPFERSTANPYISSDSEIKQFDLFGRFEFIMKDALSFDVKFINPFAYDPADIETDLGSGFIGVEHDSHLARFTLHNGFIALSAGERISIWTDMYINKVVKLPFVADTLIVEGELSDTAAQVTSDSVIVYYANEYVNVEGFGQQKPKFSPIKLFDYSKDTSLGDISCWHPAIGQHTPEAFEVIDMVSKVDPAKYNTTTQVVNNRQYDVLKPWGKKEVGKIWWNTNNLDYVPYYDKFIFPNFENRLSRWGSIAEYSQINVFEWVESDVPPEQYVAKAQEEIGDSSLAQSMKKSGEPAIPKLLKRTRDWFVRPVAWSKNEPNGSILSNSAYFNKIRLTSSSVGESTAIINHGRFSDYGVNPDMKICAWDTINEKPIGQARIVGDLSYVFGSEFNFFSPTLHSPSFVVEEKSLAPANTVASITLLNGGTGYTSVPTVTIVGGGGSGATAEAVIETSFKFGELYNISISSGGQGYQFNFEVPMYAISDQGSRILIGYGKCTLGGVHSFSISNGGSGLLNGVHYVEIRSTSNPSYLGYAEINVINNTVASVQVSNSGSGLSSTTGLYITPALPYDDEAFPIDDPTKAALRIQPTFGNFILRGPLNSFQLLVFPFGFSSNPRIEFDNGYYGTGAAGTGLTRTIQNGTVTGIRLTSGGSGYTSNPTVVISGGGGSGASATARYNSSQVTVSTFSTVNASIVVQKSDRQSSVGEAVGQIIMSNVKSGNTYYVTALEAASKKAQSLVIASLTVGASGFIDYDFNELGFKLRLVVPAGTKLTAQQIAEALGNGENTDLFIREAVNLEIEIEFPDDILVNDITDHDADAHGFGWRAWTDPTQNDLDQDLFAPDNLWTPVFGDFNKISFLTTSHISSINEYQNNKLVLKDGTQIEKFKSIWNDYVELNDVTKDVTYPGQSPFITTPSFIEFEDEKELDKNRVFVYVNGILQNSNTYTIVKNRINLVSNSVSTWLQTSAVIGTKLVAVYKKYQPNAEELSFNPEVEDDFFKNTQYKFAYDCTVIPQRDENGRITKNLYYFWVKNKNTAPFGRSMTALQAKNLLEFGPPMYMTFHNILDPVIVSDEEVLPRRYDSITIFGLNKFVAKDNTYKIRFTKNFTLRDDPNELDLKNVHSEWSLLRPSQNYRIPINLWEKVINSACAEDILGNKLPAPYLVDYDELMGTSNRFGLGADQVLAPRDQVVNSIKFAILNTKVVKRYKSVEYIDYIEFIDLSQLDKYFITPEETRKTLERIWREGKAKQVNEIFFAVIDDALANNFEFKDIFKTSRLSVHSIKTVQHKDQ